MTCSNIIFGTSTLRRYIVLGIITNRSICRDIDLLSESCWWNTLLVPKMEESVGNRNGYIGPVWLQKSCAQNWLYFFLLHPDGSRTAESLHHSSVGYEIILHKTKQTKQILKNMFCLYLSGNNFMFMLVFIVIAFQW